MSTYTPNEIDMLNAFYQASIDICGECSEEENMSYMNADDLLKELGGTKQSIGGTMASLLEKGAITDCMESARGSKLNDFVLNVFDYKDTTMKAYLINLDTTQAVGQYPTIEAAGEAGDAATYNFTVVTDAGDIESQLSRQEMVDTYNFLTGGKLKKFANKEIGATRLLGALEEHCSSAVEAPEEPSTGKKQYQKGKLHKGAVARVWEIADELNNKDEATRKNLLVACEAEGINLNTAQTQWQKWRKA